MCKRIIVFFILWCCIFAFYDVASAEKFESRGRFQMTDMHDNDCWDKKYKTSDGIIKIRFRKTSKQDMRYKYHLIIWCGNKKIGDAYFPEINGSYEIQPIKEVESGKFFIELCTPEKTSLLGYDEKSGSLNMYLHSRDFYGNTGGPKLLVTNFGDLQLNYTQNSDKYSSRYKLNYNKSSNRFTSEDITILPPPPVVVAEPEPVAPEPEFYDYGSGYSEEATYETVSEDEEEYWVDTDGDWMDT